MRLFGKKGDIDIDTVVGWGIAIIVLVLVIGLYLLLKDKGTSLIGSIKGIFGG